MNIIVIGDVHGTTHWKNIVKEYKKSDSDIVIFLGDYVDSFDIKPEQCLENLSDLFEYRCSTPNVYMLVGNHDYHYMRHDTDTYSGYQHAWMKAYRSMFLDNYHLLDIIAVMHLGSEKYVCSHAGVSKTFLEKVKTPLEELDKLWLENPKAFGFDYGTHDFYGNHPKQSPLWIRPGALLSDAIEGYNQIVGHTNIEWPTDFFTQNNDKVTVVCTENEHGFLLLKSN